MQVEDLGLPVGLPLCNKIVIDIKIRIWYFERELVRWLKNLIKYNDQGVYIMQHTCVMAFRARLKKLGYIDVHIKRKKFIDQWLYNVSAVDQLGGILISRYMSLGDMAVWR